MNIMVGDREAWHPIHAQRQHGLDGLPHPIFVRPAMRHYDVGGPFDEWRSHVAGAIPESLLDIKPIRVAYRTARSVWRSFWWGVFDVMFDGGDWHWPFGVLLVAVLFVGWLIIFKNHYR